MYEYLVIYDVEYVESFYFKVMANTYNDAKRIFLNKLLQDKSIDESEFDDLSYEYYDCLRVIALFDIETISE